MSHNPETLPQPEPADYVNDVPDWYSAAWPQERRCQHVLQTAAEYRDRWAQV